MRYSVVLIALALVLSGPVMAQGQKIMNGDALSYTTQGTGKGAAMHTRTLYQGEKPDPYRPLQKGEPAKPPTEAELEAAKVWKRYKALARGENKQKNEEEVPEEAEAEKTDQAPPTGLAGILDQYGKNKAQRSQMKTIRVTSPEELESKNAETTESK